jgi:DNA invertase Pin-like site-specific DNA recombinase
MTLFGAVAPSSTGIAENHHAREHICPLSDKQREASIEDQVRLCEERAAREGWRVVKRYTDHAISGASLMRRGIQTLMQDAQSGKFDVVLTESLDRISRDPEDIAGVYKRLRFADVKIHTLSEGEIAELHIKFTGTMSALYLKSLGEKTWRGQSGRVRAEYRKACLAPQQKVRFDHHGRARAAYHR